MNIRKYGSSAQQCSEAICVALPLHVDHKTRLHRLSTHLVCSIIPFQLRQGLRSLEPSKTHNIDRHVSRLQWSYDPFRRKLIILDFLERHEFCALVQHCAASCPSRGFCFLLLAPNILKQLVNVGVSGHENLQLLVLTMNRESVVCLLGFLAIS